MKQKFYQAIITKQQDYFLYFKKNRELNSFGDIKYIIYHKLSQPGDFANFSFIHPTRNIVVFVFAQTSFAKLNDDLQTEASSILLKDFKQTDEDDFHDEDSKIFRMVSKRRKKIRAYGWNNPLGNYPGEYFNDIKKIQIEKFNSEELYLSQGIDTETTRKGINIYYDVLKYKIDQSDVYTMIDTIIKYMANHNTFIPNLIPLTKKNKDFFAEQFLN